MATSAETVTLWCERGKHDWERPRARGAKPKNCPEHKPKPAPTLDPAERIRRQQAGRKKKQEEKDKQGIVDVKRYKEWVKEDARAWAQYQAGDITASDYRSVQRAMPKLPEQGAYDAARRAGLIAAEAPAEIDDGEE